MRRWLVTCTLGAAVDADTGDQKAEGKAQAGEETVLHQLAGKVKLYDSVVTQRCWNQQTAESNSAR